MKSIALLFAAAAALASCQNNTKETPEKGLDLTGSWRLITGSVITKGVPVVTDYTKNQEMIKILNDDHFAFLKHPTTATPDSTNKFDAGGGKYELKGDKYTEHLDFYGDKKYEHTTYNFTVSLKGDTLIQQGQEAADRSIIEKYVRLK
ncbi:hypothetical protein [Mucilaginibacter ginkgonis]|uniref:Lipocalin-like domain-containing protein n=1 Tax=Mucilaginibacter ginkgonis TaxID=2682091 RepID=A0A6I4HW58_9SPHI|nr:hypothetical protein [Mucilaginibacter ginkgonis]QQL51072.1 hypothetical protein GO620_006380 [Mucilaginibacter ginkgonis]